MSDLRKLPDDELKRAWTEAASPDDWGVPRIYEHQFCELVAYELRRWAEMIGGSPADTLRWRANQLDPQEVQNSG